MTYEKIFERADELFPNEYGEDNYKAWCREVDLEVLRNTKKQDITARAINKTEDTIICEPYTDVYIHYIAAQIALWQKDYNTYGIHKELYDKRLEEYNAWYVRVYGGEVYKFKNWI